MKNPSPSLLRAVALSYQADDDAPTVVAKGKGLIAQDIIALAKEHGVFVHESKELVSLLMQVDLDDAIPPRLYQIVAELLAWLYHIETELAKHPKKDFPPTSSSKSELPCPPSSPR